MSRTFHYKTLDDLLQDAARIGVTLPIAQTWKALAQPLHIGGRLVGNRLAIQPMEGCDGTTDGHPGELTMRRYERFGAGGAKLIWGEAAAVRPEARANPRQLIAGVDQLPALARLVELARRRHRETLGSDHDLLIGLQLTHSGRYSVPRPYLAQHDPLLDPRTIVDRVSGRRAGAEDPLLSDDELDRLQDDYIAAAKVAQHAGFDFVDLKHCHRYLLNELLAAHGRPGKYGGSFENRTRFVTQLVARIRNDCPDLIVAMRLNVFDGVPFSPHGDQRIGRPELAPAAIPSTWGTRRDDPTQPDLSEPIQLIARLRSLGLSLLNVSLGNPYASPHLLRPFEYAPVDGYLPPEHPLQGVARHLDLTATIQRAFPDLPIVGSGYSWLQAFLPDVAAGAVEQGWTTLVGVGRGALSNPDFGRQILEGTPLDRKRTCRTFSYCTALMRAKHHPTGQFPTGCPPFDKEVYGTIWRQAQQANTAK